MNLSNLAIYSREQRLALIAEKKEMIEQILSTTRKEFVHVAEKDLFDKQFETVKSRYKFLVLCGNSGTGKTWFCKHITGNPLEVLEVNCANCPEPDLRQYDPFLHKAILFDEASPAMVISQKKLFQCPPVEVALGSSTTNCHAYSIFVSGCRFVICSNTWVEDVNKMEKMGDREWLNANSFVADIGSRRLWVQ